MGTRYGILRPGVIYGLYEAETIRNVATCFERLYRCITNKLVIDRIGLQISGKYAMTRRNNDAPHYCLAALMPLNTWSMLNKPHVMSPVGNFMLQG